LGDESDEDTTPRGKVHKGYAGGEIRVPHIDPHEHLPDLAQHKIGAVLREQYEAGASIRQLAERSGYSITRVRILLQHSGTTIRGRGQQKVE
jgi:hypothetical protein